MASAIIKKFKSLSSTQMVALGYLALIVLGTALLTGLLLELAAPSRPAGRQGARG